LRGFTDGVERGFALAVTIAGHSFVQRAVELFGLFERFGVFGLFELFELWRWSGC